MTFANQNRISIASLYPHTL